MDYVLLGMALSSSLHERGMGGYPMHSDLYRYHMYSSHNSSNCVAINSNSI